MKPSRRAILDCAGLRFFVMDEYQRYDEGGGHRWRTLALPEHYDWIRESLAGQTATAAALVIHAPILPVGGSAYAEHWDRAGTGAFVDFLADQGFRWIITGHWHRNMTWDLAGMTVLSTGALGGFQCSGPEPFFLFPVRAGAGLRTWRADRGGGVGVSDKRAPDEVQHRAGYARERLAAYGAHMGGDLERVGDVA